MAAVAGCDGSRQCAANRLGISRMTNLNDAVAIVDDDAGVRGSLKFLLEAVGTGSTPILSRQRYSTIVRSGQAA